MAEYTQFFAQGAPKFRKVCNSFAGFWHKICVSSTPRASFFGYSCNADSINSIGDVLKYAQRTLAECMQFLCARRAGFLKILQNVSPIFAQILRAPDAGLARNLALECISIQKRAATKRCGLRNHAGRVHAVFMRAAPRNFSETLQIFRAIILGAKFA